MIGSDLTNGSAWLCIALPNSVSKVMGDLEAMEQYFNKDIDSKQYVYPPRLSKSWVSQRQVRYMLPLQVNRNEMNRQVTCYFGDNDGSNVDLPSGVLDC